MAHEVKRQKISETLHVATRIADDAAPAETPGFGMSSEEDVGITEYISDHAGFFGVLKQRYTDFLVNEIDLTGNVVHLTDLTVSRPAPAPEPEENKVGGDGEDAAEQEDALVVTLGESAAREIRELAASHERERVVLVPFTGDKGARTKAHEAIRRCCPNLSSDTVDGATPEQKSVRVRLNRDSQGNRRDRRGGNNRPKGPDYTAFVLYKENRDTMSAISLLATLLKGNNKQFSYAGTKDRRGVTAQNVAVFRITPERLGGLNKTLMGIRLGNFRPVSVPLRLGELRGNRFVITIRNVTCDAETANSACASLSQRGFINYYGLQRFGTTSIPTHAIGSALLRGQYERAVDLILAPRENDTPELSRARKLWTEKRDPAAALAMLPRQFDIERRLLHSLDANGKTDYLGAIRIGIPRNLRLMYVHSYQSHVWNLMASERIRRYGIGGAVCGDVVVAQPGDSIEESAQEDLPEGHAAADVPATADAPAESTDAADGAAAVASEDRTRSTAAKVRVLTAEDAASGRYSIHDVLLPLPGYDVIYPAHEIGEMYHVRMRHDEIDLSEAGRSRLREFALSGGYRPLVARPADFVWRLIRYSDPNETLAKTDLDRLKERTSGTSSAGDRMETDSVASTAQLADASKPYVALQFEMSLPSSTYATMAIRELLKSSTVTRHHAQRNAMGPSQPQSTENEVVVADSTSAAVAVVTADGAEPMN